jgi:hypothetical protein
VNGAAFGLKPIWSGEVSKPRVMRGRTFFWREPGIGSGMGDKGSKDKGKREQRKKALLSPKEKRKAKREKKASK